MNDVGCETAVIENSNNGNRSDENLGNKFRFIFYDFTSTSDVFP